MGRSARVTSIASVKGFSASLRCFQDDASKVLEGLEGEIRRAVQWVGRDQKNYWIRELRRGEQRVEEAKLNLQRCLMFKRVGDHRPSCIEEKRALERAKRRVSLCREKLDRVQHWAREVDRAVFEYEGSVGQLARWLEADAERALALLDRISRSLEAYLAVKPPPEDAALLERLVPGHDPPSETDRPAGPQASDGPSQASNDPSQEASGAAAPDDVEHDPDEEVSP